MKATLFVLAVAVLLSGCSGRGGAEGFVEEHFERIDRGDYPTLYDSLFPEQRAKVPWATFAKCYRQQTGALILSDIRATGSKKQPKERVAGTGVVWTSTLVAVEGKLNGRPFSDTMHVYRIEGEWYWVLTEEAVEAYSEERCD